MKLKLDKRSPMYLQVIQYFKEEIVSGRLVPGEEIPSRRELANELKINPNTVQRAYKEMEEMGLIFTDGNLPSEVTNDEALIERTRKELVADAMDEFIRSVQSIPVPLEELLELIEEKYRDAMNKQEGKR